MTIERSRRELILCAGSLLALACCRGRRRRDAHDPFEHVEVTIGGRVGVFALDVESGASLGRRAQERFAMCSVFKWLLAAAVLERVDAGAFALDEPLRYSESDLLEYAPATREHVADGAMTIEALARAAVTKSDNTAANLLLAKVGGPAGVTAFLRREGDPDTRLDRIEPALNENAPGDARDTATPRSMVGSMRRILCGDVLSPRARGLLTDWMKQCETGNERLRAGLPADWSAGDKTGTGLGGATNDVAIATPPGRGPILVAAFSSGSAAPLPQRNAALAEIARIVAREMAGGRRR